MAYVLDMAYVHSITTLIIKKGNSNDTNLWRHHRGTHGSGSV